LHESSWDVAKDATSELKMQNQREFPFGPENGTDHTPIRPVRDIVRNNFHPERPYGSEIFTSTAALPNIPPLLQHFSLPSPF
jgi:hypothetical protein